MQINIVYYNYNFSKNKYLLMSFIPYINSQTQARDRQMRNNIFILKKQRPFYFRKFLKSDRTQFPVGKGQCVISQECRDQFCYSFVPDEQLGFRNITDVIFRSQTKCKRCGATYTYKSIIFDHHLKALFQRSFTNEQFKTIDRAFILPNFIVQIGRQAQWQSLQSNLNQIRLQKINKIHQQWITDTKKVFKIDYKQMHSEMQSFNKQLKQKLSEKKKRETFEEQIQIEVIQFCLFSIYKGKPTIIHYEGDNNSQSIKAYKINNFENIYMVHTTVLAFDKNSKRIFLITFNKEIYYSNLNQEEGMFDKFNKVVTFQPIGKCAISDVEGNILNYRAHYYDGNLYFVGGRSGKKLVCLVLVCKIRQLTEDFQSFNKESLLQFKRYTDLLKNIRFDFKQQGGRFHFASTIGFLKGRMVTYDKKEKPQQHPYIIVFGGIHDEKGEYVTCRQCSLINLKKQQYSYHFQCDYFGLANPSVCHFRNSKYKDYLGIIGGHQELGHKFFERQFKCCSIAEIQFEFESQKEKRIRKILDHSFSNWQQLQFCQYGAGDSNSSKFVLIKKQKNQAFTKVVVQYQFEQDDDIKTTATLQTIKP